MVHLRGKSAGKPGLSTSRRGPYGISLATMHLFEVFEFVLTVAASSFFFESFLAYVSSRRRSLSKMQLLAMLKMQTYIHVSIYFH